MKEFFTLTALTPFGITSDERVFARMVQIEPTQEALIGAMRKFAIDYNVDMDKITVRREAE